MLQFICLHKTKTFLLKQHDSPRTILWHYNMILTVSMKRRETAAKLQKVEILQWKAKGRKL